MINKQELYKSLFGQKTEAVELAKVEVELASVQDIDKLISKYKGVPDNMLQLESLLSKTFMDLSKLSKELSNLQTRATTELSKNGDAFDIMGKTINIINDKARSLGLNPTDIPNYKELDKLQSEATVATSKLRNMLDKTK